MSPAEVFARQHGTGDRLLRPGASNGVFGTGDEPFRLRHSPAASPCHLEHSTPPQLGNVAGAFSAVSDVILEACKCHGISYGESVRVRNVVSYFRRFNRNGLNRQKSCTAISSMGTTISASAKSAISPSMVVVMVFSEV